MALGPTPPFSSKGMGQPLYHSCSRHSGRASSQPWMQTLNTGHSGVGVSLEEAEAMPLHTGQCRAW